MFLQWKERAGGTCLSPPVVPKVWRRPFWMTLESPSRVRSYKQWEEGGKKKRVNRDKEISMLRKRRKRLGTNPWCKWNSNLVMQTICQVKHHAHLIRIQSVWLCIHVCFTTHHYNHAYRAYAFVFVMPPTQRHHMTHRAWYVCAGCPLAIRTGCSHTSDLLLLA